jgi:hypothetical protein
MRGPLPAARMATFNGLMVGFLRGPKYSKCGHFPFIVRSHHIKLSTTIVLDNCKDNPLRWSFVAIIIAPHLPLMAFSD